MKTLTSTISAIFKKELPDEKIARLIGELIAKGMIKVDAKKVIYTLPD